MLGPVTQPDGTLTPLWVYVAGTIGAMLIVAVLVVVT
jgi:hypothetical protein